MANMAQRGLEHRVGTAPVAASAHRGKYVAYYRVSTERQGRSGLGLDAQKAAVQNKLNGGSWVLAAEYTETESGRKAQRPQLLLALAACRKLKATLIVGKLDRLTRNTKFLLTLIDSGVEVLFCDLPEATGAMGRFILTTMVSAAELEAGLVSERTKAALAAAKKRGRKLGTYGKVLAAKNRSAARARAQELAPVIREMQKDGLSLNEMAAELNSRKVSTHTGSVWYAQTVSRVVQRLTRKH
jgi:DNA invertase Pin-like site-specific DNA recombinase